MLEDMRKVLAGMAMAFLVAGAMAGPGMAATHSNGLRLCKKLDVGSLHVSKIGTNLTCNSARKVLRRLLRNGIDQLPKVGRARSGWVCRKDGSMRLCKRPSGRRGATSRIRFRAVSVRAQAGPKPAPPPTPVPPPPPGPGVTPAPQDCLDLWNAAQSHNFPDDGVHFYLDHAIRQGWVFHLPDLRCAVVFVVPASDPYLYEFGTDGEVSRLGGGWDLMNDVFVSNYIDVQKQAPDNANVSLDATGKLARL